MSGLRDIQGQVSWTDLKGMELVMDNGDWGTKQMLWHYSGNGCWGLERSDMVGREDLG